MTAAGKMNLNPTEKKVLACLAEEAGLDTYCGESYYCFAVISEWIHLDRKEIRRACRSLARKGLTEYGRGLWNDFGPAGAGYRLTKAGREAAQT
jgi:hypothetical protein